MNVVDQVGLCIGRPRDENRTGVRDRCRNRVQKLLVRRHVPAPNRIGLVMDVLCRMLRAQDQPFDLCWAEMEHPRLAMIYPDDSVKVMSAHGMSPVQAIERGIPVNAQLNGG